MVLFPGESCHFLSGDVEENIIQLTRGGEGQGVVGSNLLGMCHSHQNPPYSITVYSVASYSPHLSDFWANVIFVIQTQG